MADRYMKKRSASLIIVEMKTETTTSHSLAWLLSERRERTSVGEDVEKRKLVCTTDGNVNWYGH